MQSVPTITNVVGLTRAQDEEYNSNLSLTCGRSVVFSGSSTNKTDRHDITEILLKVALNTIKQTASL
jgi:hypothetical protein